jgi:hypothetical protein
VDFSSRFVALQEQVADARSSVQAAGSESRDQLKRRIDQAKAGRNEATSDTQRSAPAPTNKWDQMRANAADKMNEIKARIDKRNQQMNADMGAADADLAEADAEAAIEQAVWAVDNARLAALDAIDARAYANAQAGQATS